MASTNRWLYNGKELQNAAGLDLLDYGFRMYDAFKGSWNGIDKLAEQYLNLNPYSYAGNNPVRFIDIKGLYFDQKDVKIAANLDTKLNKVISKVEKQIAKIEKKGGDIGDRAERLNELKQSKQDIADMRNDQSTQYVYENARKNDGKPEIKLTGTNDKGHNIITMYNHSDGSAIHESRHGGQYVRGEINITANGGSDGYGLDSEVSAYRAQYSFDGYLRYLDPQNIMHQQIVNQGLDPALSSVKNIYQITPEFVKKNLGEKVEIRKDYIVIRPLYPGLK
ncbi:MAG: hypothetical protein LUF87_03805 [Alistipes sp.]|nr:hypothetical protein [Alistipes sp.]